MPTTPTQKRAAFRALHKEGCFVLPNPWDIGSARMLQEMGYSALASTSSGYAWTMGKPDYAVTRDEALAHLTALNNAVDLPINADFEAGFAADPEGVAANVALAIKTGVAGLSIEDRDLAAARLYDTRASLERLRAARRAIDESGEDVLLVARTEGLLLDASMVSPAIDKLVAFAAAGADCLYAPGVWKKDDVAAMGPRDLRSDVEAKAQALLAGWRSAPRERLKYAHHRGGRYDSALVHNCQRKLAIGCRRNAHRLVLGSVNQSVAEEI